MARKVERKPEQPAAESNSAADAIAALKPEASITIAGRAITVREYGFFEGLEVAHRASAFFADMQAAALGGPIRYATVRRLFGVHQGVVVPIAAQAADVEPEWVRGLGDRDADTFMSTWFAVNVGFFMREVVGSLQEEQLLRSMASRSTGSSSGSPELASATSTASADLPSAS
jgi:hypothetical protein